MSTAETQEIANTTLERIAWLSSQNADQEFTSLMHHVNVEALRCCFQRLDGKKAVGTDGITKAKFGENLDANLQKLVASMKSMGYRPGPVRQVLIPKEGKPGATRPLGISNFNDKLIQKRFEELLEAIYDPIFLDCSYGFRPGRGCHDAIKALSDYLYVNEVETVIDVDLANFFGTIDQTLLIEMLERKIKDTRFIRYIKRMFKAGMLTEGELRMNEEVVVQGSCCSPVFWTKRGRPNVKLKTCSKRFRSKLKKINIWAREKRAIYALDEYWKRYAAMIRGHIQYYGVSHNSLTVSKFVLESKYIVFKWLNRRSQRKSFNWSEFELLVKRMPLPVVSVKHRLF
jgi:hypothetical protein